jgi:DNA polymerase-3 subunit alpha
MSASPSPRFVHLRLHSEYSVTDGLIRLDAAVARARADGMPALALTDLANMFGMIKFYSGARGVGVKPIMGVDVRIAGDTAGDDSRDATPRLLLLAKNQAGYLRLCELLTTAYLVSRRHGRVEITHAAIANGDNSGLIALSGGAAGDVSLWLAAGKPTKARDCAAAWARLFPGSYYLEVQRYGQPQQEAQVAQIVALAGALDLPVVATHPVQFLDPADFEAHEARVCIAEGYVLADPRRPHHFTTEQYFKTQDEMAALFADLPEALENSLEVAKRCSVSLELGKSRLPVFPTSAGVSLDEYLLQQSRIGLEQRLAQLFPDAAEREKQQSRYTERLAFECQTIQQMGFSGYFLIVADFIQWAKKNGVPVGPGRGSGAGSLVAYSLLITDLDPIRYDLLFERFLNPERVSMPDFDIDFCQEGRDRVIHYVKEKYGSHAVSQIVTFGTMAAKAVIRDVGRVLDLGFNFVDQFAKLIPNELGITLAKAMESEPAIAQRLDEEEGLRTLWDLALKLEGVTRNVGMHAGGVLLAPGKLTDFCPLYSADGGLTTVSQFDKDDVEKAGLVKFDFLGLRTLTILAEAVHFARAIDGADINLATLPLDDKATYDNIFKNANTTAVFQFESGGMKDTLVQAKPDCIEDLIALNALYRPGPMENIPSFIARKHKREQVIYPHPKLEKVLANTYGIMIYQEQAMQAAQIIAGYSLGSADLLRRAIGKKKAEEMAQQREFFVTGAGKNGIAANKANEIFNIIEKFAGYGFNKSHAAAYSVVAFQTALLKHHHPSAFFAATLSSEMANTDKVQFFYSDARANGIAFLPPDINLSAIRFQPADGKTIRYGLGAIKGTGEAALSIILKARGTGGPFVDLFEFCRRVDKRTVNRRVIEALIRAGAFDSLDDHRHKLLASVGIALEAAEQAERNVLQSGLFDLGSSEAAQQTHYVDVPRWGGRERLLNEKQAIGFFLSGHPYNEYEQELKPFIKYRLSELQAQREPALMAGVVISTRTQMTRRGKMCIILLDDATRQIEISVFNELWEAERGKIREDALLLIEGKVQNDDYTGGLRITADRLLTLGEMRARFAKGLQLAMNGSTRASDAQRLQTILAPYRRTGTGACPVRLRYRNHVAETEITLPEDWRVTLDDALLASLNEWLTPANVKVIYA